MLIRPLKNFNNVMCLLRCRLPYTALPFLNPRIKQQGPVFNMTKDSEGRTQGVTVIEARCEIFWREWDLPILTGGIRDSFEIDGGMRDENQKITGYGDKLYQ